MSKTKSTQTRNFEIEFVAKLRKVFEKFSKLTPMKKRYFLGFVRGVTACQKDEQIKDLLQQIFDALQTVGKKGKKAEIIVGRLKN
ncbi:MAG: hypothetical protein M3388_14655 [Acidobacteriota bacterium]|nr:hypothetical protein [Acidobacteriota bacterium]